MSNSNNNKKKWKTVILHINANINFTSRKNIYTRRSVSFSLKPVARYTQFSNIFQFSIPKATGIELIAFFIVTDYEDE